MILRGGLKPGDKLIVQGLSKLKPGQQVNPVASTTPQNVQVPRDKDGKPVTGKPGGKKGG